MSRSIYIDDNDTRIQYTGSWDINIGSHDAMGSFGAPYLRTMHGTQSWGNLSYAFNGTSLFTHEILPILRDAQVAMWLSSVRTQCPRILPIVVLSMVNLFPPSTEVP